MLQSSRVPHSPLLVIAASMPSEEAATSRTHPPVQVANWLSLIHIQHPWQVTVHCSHVPIIIVSSCHTCRCSQFHWTLLLVSMVAWTGFYKQHKFKIIIKLADCTCPSSFWLAMCYNYSVHFGITLIITLNSYTVLFVALIHHMILYLA